MNDDTLVETQKSSGIVLEGTAHLDGHIDSEEGDCINFVFTLGCIHMDQLSRDRDGNPVENEIVIASEWQAMAVVQIIRAMAAANGWEI